MPPKINNVGAKPSGFTCITLTAADIVNNINVNNNVTLRAFFINDFFQNELIYMTKLTK